MAVSAASILTGAGPAGKDEAGKDWQPRPEEVKKDMTADAVLKLAGKPDRIARQILFRRHLEQWVYDDLGLRVEFNCVLGEEPRVQSVWREKRSKSP